MTLALSAALAIGADNLEVDMQDPTLDSAGAQRLGVAAAALAACDYAPVTDDEWSAAYVAHEALELAALDEAEGCPEWGAKARAAAASIEAAFADRGSPIYPGSPPAAPQLRSSAGGVRAPSTL